MVTSVRCQRRRACRVCRGGGGGGGLHQRLRCSGRVVSEALGPFDLVTLRTTVFGSEN